MRLVSKFALAFFVLSCALLSVFAYDSAREEADRIETLLASDLEILGTGLRDGLVATWETSDRAGARSLVELAIHGREGFTISWQPGEVTSEGVQREVRGSERWIRIRIPVVVGGVPRGAVELSRALPSQRDLLRTAFLEEARIALLLAVLEAILAMVIGSAVIGAPLNRIVAQARRIGAGDFSQRLREGRTDEIGALKSELNAMCDKLVEARLRVETETNARLATLDQLRHLDRLGTVGTIASSLAHELGTPLNVLLIRGQSLMDGGVPRDEVPEAGRTIVNQVEKMSRIVRGLLGFARKETTKRREPLSLSATARSSAGLVESIAKKAGIAIEFEAKEDPQVIGDAIYLEQALTNLLVNAIQATRPGSTVRVRVTADDAAKPPRSARQVSVGCVQVIDEGPGITKENLPRIFDPFFTTKVVEAGTGLGLSVAAGIAEEHGGWVSVETSEGQGSTFSLHLPRTS